MRTLWFVVGGLVLGGLVSAGGRAAGVSARTALSAFAVLWVAVAAWNLYEGVTAAGYSVVEELPIFLVIALLPIAATWWFSGR